MKNKVLLLVAVLIVVVAAIAGFIGYSLYSMTKTTPANSYADGAGMPVYGGSFNLVTNKNKPITDKQFKAKPSVVFFGFTNCPDVCPTTLAEMTNIINKLGADSDKLGFYFVTVDPERDTPETLDNYLSLFSAKIIGITGKLQPVRDMLKQFNIYYKKIYTNPDYYTMDHSASVLLLDSKQHLYGTVSYGEKPDIALAKVKRLIANN